MRVGLRGQFQASWPFRTRGSVSTATDGRRARFRAAADAVLPDARHSSRTAALRKVRAGESRHRTEFVEGVSVVVRLRFLYAASLMKAALPQAADADRHHHRRAARRAGGAFLGFLGLVADVEEAGWLAVIGVLGGAGAGGLLGGVVGSACASVSRRHASAATASPDSHATAGISSSATNAGSARAPSRRPSPPAMVVSSTSATTIGAGLQANPRSRPCLHARPPAHRRRHLRHGPARPLLDHHRWREPTLVGIGAVTAIPGLAYEAAGALARSALPGVICQSSAAACRGA